jgi:hypothetical protein
MVKARRFEKNCLLERRHLVFDHALVHHSDLVVVVPLERAAHLLAFHLELDLLEQDDKG